MPSVLSQLDRIFRNAIQAAFGLDADPIVGVSQNEKFGDYQSNAAMGLSKIVAEKTSQKTNPRQIAEQIKARLELGEIASEVSIAGPGFINVRLSPIWLASQLKEVAADERMGIPRTSSPQTVVVDYSGPNIAKQMHVGHLRSTIIGDAISRVIEFQGHNVIRQNHIGDWGTQFGRVILAIWHLCMACHHDDPDYPRRMLGLLSGATQKDDCALRAQLIQEIAQRHQSDYDLDREGWEIFKRYLDAYAADLDELLPAYQFVSTVEETPEAQLEKIVDRDGTRPLAAVSRHITSQLQRGPTEYPQEYAAWEKAREITLRHVYNIYRRMNVNLAESDVRGESFYNPILADVVGDLQKKTIAIDSAGAVAVFADGPDKSPLIVRKSDGAYLYGTTDLAAIRFRINELHANRIIYTHDSRQAQHFSQVFRTADKASWTRHGEVKLEYAPFGTMLGEDGKPFKTRSGDTVKLAELLNEAEARARKVVEEKNPELPDQQRSDIAHAVGIGAVKYSDLSKERTSDYVFSWEKMLSLDGNTAPYLQYVYARIRSIFRKAGGATGQGQPLRLESPFELPLAKHILQLSEVVDVVARELKPHYLCTYLYELASKFSGFYENCPVLQSEEPTRSSRLQLCDLTARTMARGLDLLGIEHPEQM